MSIKHLSSDEIQQLVGTRHAQTGIEYPPDGLQPYYEWLMRVLHLLAESSAGALRVAESDADKASVHIAPGRASISDVPLTYSGGVVALAAFNNDTAHVALINDDDVAAIEVLSESNGWPAAPHLKLAEVTLESGRIVSILDRRFETVFRV